MPDNDKSNTDKRPIKSAVALWLTFIAGFVDIAGAITIYDIFSAHMTGTTVRLGEHLVQRDWNALGITGLVLAAFVAGSLVGRILIEAAARANFRSIAAITLGCCGNGIPDGNPDAGRTAHGEHHIRHRDDQQALPVAVALDVSHL